MYGGNAKIDHFIWHKQRYSCLPSHAYVAIHQLTYTDISQAGTVHVVKRSGMFRALFKRVRYRVLLLYSICPLWWYFSGYQNHILSLLTAVQTQVNMLLSVPILEALVVRMDERRGCCAQRDLQGNYLIGCKKALCDLNLRVFSVKCKIIGSV